MSIEKEIVANKRKLTELLREKYTVDYFQRDYKWERKHIEQLLVDLEASFLSNYEIGHSLADVSDYNGYYLGPVVICQLGRNRSIVDGQQRLTSITLLLIYLNNLQKDTLEKEDVAPLIFSRKGGATSFNIEVPQRQAVLSSLFNKGKYELKDNDDFSVKNMNDRYIDIINYFPEELKFDKLPLFIEWLKENVVFVEILAHSNENAYTIFETMNDRGLNLTPSEMLKGYVLTNIGDSERIDEINDLWRKQVSSLHRYSLQEDQEFIKAWLRSAYAETIRSSAKGSENEDFEKIGTRFHTWIKDNHKKLGLRDSESFYYFIKGDFDFYANLYSRILYTERHLTPGLEILFLASEWNIADSLAYPLLMAPINKLDDEETIVIKLQSVYRFLDIFTVSRCLNYKSITQTAIRYTIYSLVKEIRNKDVTELRRILKEKLEESIGGLDNLLHFNYQYENRQFIQYLFARMIYYVDDVYSEDGVQFLDLLPSRKKNRMVINQIVDTDMEKYGSLFANEDELRQACRLLGNYVLMSNLNTNIFNSIHSFDKLTVLLDENLLNDSAVNVNDFSRSFDVLPMNEISYQSIYYRTVQLARLAREIWNPELI